MLQPANYSQDLYFYMAGADSAGDNKIWDRVKFYVDLLSINFRVILVNIVLIR